MTGFGRVVLELKYGRAPFPSRVLQGGHPWRAGGPGIRPVAISCVDFVLGAGGDRHTSASRVERPGGQSARTGGSILRVRRARSGSRSSVARWVSQRRQARRLHQRDASPGLRGCAGAVWSRWPDFRGVPQTAPGGIQRPGQTGGDRDRGGGSLLVKNGHRSAGCRVGRRSGDGSHLPGTA